MDYNAANEFLKTRLSLPTELSSKGISESLPPAIRAHCFFSARVAEARVLEELRSVSDQYSAGKLSLAEGRKILAKWLDAHAIGDPKSARMSNIASSMRLDLILRQNAAMAAAVGRYQVSRDPDIEERWPCWRYIAGHNPRPEHKALDGKVIRKDDPFWHSHYPPWDFNCNCDVEDSDEKPDPTPQHDDHAPASGFQFDPAHAFEKVDLSGISRYYRGKIREDAEIQFGDQVSFVNDNKNTSFEEKGYRGFRDFGLPSAKEWVPTPSPDRISPEKAENYLREGVEIVTGDGRKVILDHTILDHWTIETKKLDSDIKSRLSCWNYAIETLQHPIERWDQETQCRYLKVFQKKTGGFEGCMVVVTNDGKCRTYFLPSVSKIDNSRTGISYKVIEK